MPAGVTPAGIIAFERDPVLVVRVQIPCGNDKVVAQEKLKRRVRFLYQMNSGPCKESQKNPT